MTGYDAPFSRRDVRLIRVILLLLLLLAAGLLAAAVFVPVEVRVVAPGNVAGERQIVAVRAIESGAVRTVHVRNGQRVRAGETLVDLDSAWLDDQRLLLREKIAQLECQLLGERAELDLLQRNDDRVSAAIAQGDAGSLRPLRAFHPACEAGDRYRMRLLVSALDLALTRAANTQRHLQYLDEQVEFASRQLTLLESDRDGAQSLLKKGGTSEAGWRTTQRAVEDQRLGLARLQSDRQRLLDSREDLKREAYLQFAERADALETSIRQKALDLTDQKLRLREVESDLEKRIVRSPVDGVVVDLNDLVAANFVMESEIMLRIMPLAQLRRVQARVAIDDIDKVNRQAPAMIRFSANALLRDDLIEAAITKINPVASSDNSPTPERYYEVFLQIDDPLYDPVSARIFSDAPVDVLFSVERTTVARALLRPITRNWPRIFER